MRGRRRFPLGVVLAGFAVLITAGCNQAEDRADLAKIPDGAVCHVCGMNADDLGFASLLRTPEGDKVFDAIECAVRHVRLHPGGNVWLPDLPSGVLQPADSMRVVKANYPSPMGGGYAAFLDHDLAGREAAARGGVSATWQETVAGTAPAP